MFPYFTDLNGVTNAIFTGIPGREIRGCDLLGCTFCIIRGVGEAAEAAPFDETCGEWGSGALLSLDSAKLIPLGFGQAEARAPCHRG